MASDPREAEIALRVRATVVVAAIIGIATVLVEPRQNGFFMAVLFAPAGWVFMRPRWGRIVMWAMWIVPIVMLLALINVERFAQFVAPTGILVGMISVLVLVVIPLVRRGYRQPPLPMSRQSNLPAARMVKR